MKDNALRRYLIEVSDIDNKDVGKYHCIVEIPNIPLKYLDMRMVKEEVGYKVSSIIELTIEK
jgi:hypothetical protein